MVQHSSIDHTGITGAGAPQALDTTDSPQFAGVNIGHASDTTLTRVSAGVVAIEGTNIVKAGAATGSGLTMATARILGRTTASTGAIEELSAGTNITIAGGTISAAGGSGVSSGTSNPGSPSDGDLFYRTDLDLLIRYRSSGTRWVTADLYRETMGVGDNLQPFSAGGGQAAARWSPWFTTWDLWLETLYTSTYVATTNNGSNYWTAALVKYTAAAAATTIVSPNTSADTASNFVTKATSIGAALGTTNKHLTLELTKTAGAPGNIYCVAAIAYRLIVT